MRWGGQRLAGLCGLALVAASLVVTPTNATAQGASVTCRGLPATIVGTELPDTLYGTSGPDVIAGLAGDDRIRGGGGDDVICGGDGADQLKGGRGDDRLYGQLDSLDFRASSGGAEWYVRIGDWLAGGPGDDHLDAGQDPRPEQVEELDAVVFGGRHGVLLRLAGAGELGSSVGEGHDTVVGQRDLQIGGTPGPDDIWGSSLADNIAAGGGNDVVRGRGGKDWLGDGGTQTARDRDVLLGGADADRLDSSYGADVLKGGAGGDEIFGNSPHLAQMRGGPGNDQLYSQRVGRACPIVDGGGGSRDWFEADSFLGGSTAKVRIVLDGPVNGCGAARGIEFLAVGNGTLDHWEVVGTDGAENVYAGISGVPLVAHMRDGDDKVTGGEADDFLVGGAGNDTVDAWNGTDTCRGFEVLEHCERG